MMLSAIWMELETYACDEIVKVFIMLPEFRNALIGHTNTMRHNA